jgi:cystathionine beta-lyase
MEVASAAAPDDCYLALRGLRTLAARLERHQRSALEVAAGSRPARGRQPSSTRPSPAAPGHDLWRRDFLGASGLFAFVLNPARRPRSPPWSTTRSCSAWATAGAATRAS